MRIIQLANLYAPASGGLRTALDTLGRGYAAAGHERVLVIPGRGWDTQRGPDGTVLTVPGVAVGGGYRIILRKTVVERLLTRMRPDVIEVSDKYTLTGLAQWAADNSVGSVLFSHERLDAIVPARFPVTARSAAAHSAIHAWNRRLARRFDAVVVTSAFAEDEFSGLGVRALHRVPLGVDLDLFRPRPLGEPGPVAFAAPGTARTRLAYAGRLSPEKKVPLAITTVQELVGGGHDVHLDVYGSGTDLPRLEKLAAGLPVTFHGHIAERTRLAAQLASADVVLAPCGVESFGLAVLEALACGTPVVTTTAGAAGEMVTEQSGYVAEPNPSAMADGVLRILKLPEVERRVAARAQAELHPWSRTVAGMLEVHSSLAELRARERGRGRDGDEWAA